MNIESTYKDDILKDGFQQKTIPLRDDYEGKVVATLIRRLTSNSTNKAVLYIHGFNDYFFQKEMAFHFNDLNINFYALDLRKYGRSYLPHQKFNDTRNLKDYFEEIQAALDIIREEENRKVLLMGHSTGGLIITLFAKKYPDSNLYNGLILNSPFFEFNYNWLVRKAIGIISAIGGLFPTIKISGGFTPKYGESIHKNYKGEWDYNLKWKPNVAPRINLGWLRAIYKAQSELKKAFHINKPVLIMHSAESVNASEGINEIKHKDVILNVKDISKIAINIKGKVDDIAIKGGMHDLILSQKEIRNKVYNIITSWLNKIEF